jgi:anti-sigma regulatory factor (Ser/Thr protein kinase)
MAGDRDRRFRVFPAAVASVSVARQWARRVLSGWGLGASDAELAFNEMVTNAIVHGSGDVHADLTRLNSGVRLEVHDQGGPGPVVHRHPRHDQSGGRGFEIISRVATNWGWSKPASGGTTVWALVPKNSFRPHVVPRGSAC